MSVTGIVPPEEALVLPPDTMLTGDAVWTLLASSRRVNNGWCAIINRDPKAAARWFAYLSRQAMSRYPGRVYPLKGSVYAGAWECEVSAGDRLFYKPDANTMRVVVYYAGPHPKTTPRPPA